MSKYNSRQNLAAYLSEKDKETPGLSGMRATSMHDFASTPRTGLPEVIKPPSIPTIPNAAPNWTPYRKKKDTII